jgi:hypothetical protein
MTTHVELHLHLQVAGGRGGRCTAVVLMCHWQQIEKKVPRFKISQLLDSDKNKKETYLTTTTRRRHPLRLHPHKASQSCPPET